MRDDKIILDWIRNNMVEQDRIELHVKSISQFNNFLVFCIFCLSSHGFKRKVQQNANKYYSHISYYDHHHYFCIINIVHEQNRYD